MKTKKAILADIKRVKECSSAQLDRYIKRFNITPLGVRQRPQLFPDDSADTILKQLGLVEGPNGTLLNPEHQCGSAWPDKPKKETRVVSMRELRHERSRGQRRAA